MSVLTAALWVAAGLFGAAVLLGFVRIATAPDDASRAVVGDLVYFSAVGILVVLGMLTGSSVADLAAMIASLLGILATVALARILTRGRR